MKLPAGSVTAAAMAGQSALTRSLTVAARAVAARAAERVGRRRCQGFWWRAERSRRVGPIGLGWGYRGQSGRARAAAAARRAAPRRTAPRRCQRAHAKPETHPGQRSRGRTSSWWWAGAGEGEAHNLFGRGRGCLWPSSRNAANVPSTSEKSGHARVRRLEREGVRLTHLHKRCVRERWRGME